MRDIKTYKEFWPYYLREHSKPATRAFHYFGTALGLAVLVWAVMSGYWYAFPLMFVIGYFFAWVSHGFIERNRPATFTYPLWSLFSDFKMLFCFVTGQMKKELRKAGVKPSEA